MTGSGKTIYKICREQDGYTQERAAELLPCSVRALARYESGECGMPDNLAYRMVRLYNSQFLAVEHLRHDKPFDYVYLIEGKAYCPITAQLTQNQFDALVSFTYNCGGGCLKTLCKDRTAAQIAAKLPLYKQERGAGRGGPNAAQNGGAGAV